MVKRYRPTVRWNRPNTQEPPYEAILEEDPKGNWVNITDYELLLRELDQMHDVSLYDLEMAAG